MGEEDRYSAQCAWLFSHAHLIGETCIEFEDRGTKELKGVPGEWRLYAARLRSTERGG